MNDANSPGAGQSRNAASPANTQTSKHQPSQITPPNVSAPSTARPSESWIEMATNAGIVPTASDGNDSSISFDWKPVELIPNRSCFCEISGIADHALTARIEQPPYDRTLRGRGTVKIATIPVAAVGTKGKLTLRDETSGGIAEYSWEWKPIKQAKWITPPKTATQNATVPKKQTQRRSTWTPTSAGNKSFFGVPVGAGDAATAACAPTRYAFILDMSGSMRMSGNRWQTCIQQLTTALEGLPVSARVFVILFSSALATPPGQEDWMPAEPEWKESVLRWLASITPDGGTIPGPAFEKLFSLAEQPEVIYFLTDGLFTDVTAAGLKQLSGRSSSNSGGFFKKAARMMFGGKDDSAASPTINTITLEDSSGAQLCKDIADAFEGQYVHAQTEAE